MSIASAHAAVARKRAHRWSLVVVALLLLFTSACSPTSGADGLGARSSDRLTPADVGTWSEVTPGQVFDSQLDPMEVKATTTDEMVSRISAEYREAQLFTEKVRFRDGAKPTLERLVFYGPVSEAKNDTLTGVGLVAIIALPEVVNGDSAMLEEFGSTRTASSFEGSKHVFFWTERGEVMAIVGRYLVHGSAVMRNAEYTLGSAKPPYYESVDFGEALATHLKSLAG